MRIHSGRLKGRRLPVPPGARPIGGRLKVSLFSVLTPYLHEARVLDLCAGAGGMGLEALSRGAAEVVLVDKDPRICQALRAWLREADPEGGGTVRRGDVLTGTLPEGPFDVILLDPPYPLWEPESTLRMVGRAVARLAPEGLLVCKVPAKMDLPEDPRWRLIRRTAVASAAYALLTPTGDEGGAPESRHGDQAEGKGGRIDK